MIESYYALVADRTMFRSVTAGCNVTEMTPTVLDNVRMFLTIEFRHYEIRWSRSYSRISRIEKKNSEMKKQVNEEDGGQEDRKKRTQAKWFEQRRRHGEGAATDEQ